MDIVELKKVIIEKIDNNKDIIAIEITKNIVYLFEQMDSVVKVDKSTYGGKNLIHFYNLKYGEKLYRVMIINSETPQIKFIIDPVNSIYDTIEIDGISIFKLDKGGIYELINENDVNERYVVLISGVEPFLKWEFTWDKNKKMIANDDKLRGKNFIWVTK